MDFRKVNRNIVQMGLAISLLSCKPLLDTTLIVPTAQTLTLNTIGVSSATSLSTSAPAAVVYDSVTVDLGSDFLAANVCSTKTIFGLAGSASCAASGVSAVVSLNNVLQSNALRTLGTASISQKDETSTYAGVALPAQYRKVPLLATDTLANATYSSRPIVDCGASGALAARISDCLVQNPTTATWEGTTQGAHSETAWHLVSRQGANKEVWQDARTGLLWSSKVSLGDNWCMASGNMEATDPSGYCNNVTYQPDYPTLARSYCAEELGLDSAIGTETWGTGTYDAAKGGMGANSSPSVQWRLPTIQDYYQAALDGIIYVMPDATADDEWTSVVGLNPANAYAFYALEMSVNRIDRSTATLHIRCVGH